MAIAIDHGRLNKKNFYRHVHVWFLATSLTRNNSWLEAKRELVWQLKEKRRHENRATATNYHLLAAHVKADKEAGMEILKRGHGRKSEHWDHTRKRKSFDNIAQTARESESAKKLGDRSLSFSNDGVAEFFNEDLTKTSNFPQHVKITTRTLNNSSCTKNAPSLAPMHSRISLIRDHN